MPIEIPYSTICGVRFACAGRHQSVGALLKNAEQKKGGYVCVTGAHGVVHSSHHSEFREILNNAVMNTLDGQPIVWMARLKGYAVEERVTGRELLHDIVVRDISCSIIHGFFGATKDVTDRMVNAVKHLNPGVHVDLVINPPFGHIDDDTLDEICKQVEMKSISMLWVGLSTPKQEALSARLSQRLPSTTIVAIGAGFDFIAGLKSSAPKFITKIGLEWLFRLLTEPRRLTGRYIKIVPQFLLLASRELITNRNNGGKE